MGVGAIFVILNFVVPRFQPRFSTTGGMKIPIPTLIMLQASRIVQDWWWLVALVVGGLVIGFRLFIGTPKRKILVGYESPETAYSGRRYAKGRDIAFRAGDVDAGGQ